MRSTLRPALTTCVTLFDYQASGGGGIRTPGACARRFSRPLPSTTRPLLQEDPEVAAQYRDRRSLVKRDLRETGATRHSRCRPGRRAKRNRQAPRIESLREELPSRRGGSDPVAYGRTSTRSASDFHRQGAEPPSSEVVELALRRTRTHPPSRHLVPCAEPRGGVVTCPSRNAGRSSEGLNRQGRRGRQELRFGRTRRASSVERATVHRRLLAPRCRPHIHRNVRNGIWFRSWRPWRPWRFKTLTAESRDLRSRTRRRSINLGGESRTP
jgi:hypothetical protein